MGQTRIFISSTCYDLTHIRQALHSHISELGHIPIMSEFSAFSVDPRLSNLENCKKNVRDNADLFILIVGMKKGSVDSASGKSIVNLEYEAAVQEGLDIFTFVDQRLIDLLPIWKSNPSNDLSAVIDSPDILKFVDSVRRSQRWTFPFRSEDDIISTIRLQVSSQLRELLSKRREGHLRHLGVFQRESERAKYFVENRPEYWEHLLTAELLESRLSRTRRQLDDVIAGRVLGPHTHVNGKKFNEYVQSKLSELISTMEKLVYVITKRIPESWGPSGIAGDPMQIYEAVSEVDDILAALVSAESETFRIHPPESMLQVKTALLGVTDTFTDTLYKAPSEIRSTIEQAINYDKSQPPTVLSINFKFDFKHTENFTRAYDAAIASMRPEDWD
ncbi:DUF4062 domain-containing protein [Terriglobus tenax]|uniref:DUF4062 domain-containing protein n=1 Tax=Terriglobus tenax TaxID=1111115 RepID=UPI0021E0E501|nr:DUF4062 domain-containing protein [Terriglobus tenax]